MFVLNYLYFLILTFLLFQYINTRNKIVRHPLDAHRKLLFNGPEMFWTLLFSTGLLALSAPAGLDLMALRLFSLEVLILLCLGVAKTRPIWAVPLVVYCVFLLWLVVGLFYSPSIPFGIRVILKYAYPILVALVASAVVRDGEVFLKAALGARCVAFACLFFSCVPFVGILVEGVFWYATAQAIHYISMCVFCLVVFFYLGRDKKDLLYAIIFALPCILWVFRTSIMGTLVGLMTFAFSATKSNHCQLLH